MKPLIIDKINGYDFVWQEHGLTIRVNKLHVHKTDSHVSGEVMITSQDEAGRSITIYPPTQFNFSADRTRTGWVKTLSGKFPEYPWAEMIDQLCYGVQEKARKGEPILELWTYQDVPPLEYLLEPVLIKGLPTIIFGEKASAKSTLALLLYTCLILPWETNPLELPAPATSIKTLYLDWETEGNIALYILKRIQRGHNLPDIPLNYRRCNSPLVNDIEQIQQHIQDCNADLIIIDSLGAAAGGDLKSPEIALGFFQALRGLKKTSLILAQTSKDEESKRKTIFGSVYFTYYSRNIFELCKAPFAERDELSVSLFHRWANLSDLYPPVSLRLHHNETGLTAERQPFDVTEFMERVSHTQKILELLKSGPLKPQEIAEDIGISLNVSQVLLSRLKKRGKVIKVAGGWGLLSKD